MRFLWTVKFLSDCDGDPRTAYSLKSPTENHVDYVGMQLSVTYSYRGNSTIIVYRNGELGHVEAVLRHVYKPEFVINQVYDICLPPGTYSVTIVADRSNATTAVEFVTIHGFSQAGNGSVCANVPDSTTTGMPANMHIYIYIPRLSWSDHPSHYQRKFLFKNLIFWLLCCTCETLCKQHKVFHAIEEILQLAKALFTVWQITNNAFCLSNRLRTEENFRRLCHAKWRQLCSSTRVSHRTIITSKYNAI